ncbi:MAG TPA: HEAT repeat domain-containing protein [Candidatus Handelsmanbacteria bacterium]|nr:HEAT repeat domain-containing protein [Candidatus Handelsmanbacteria bacterium]
MAQEAPCRSSRKPSVQRSQCPPACRIDDKKDRAPKWRPVLGRALLADRDPSVRAACAQYLGTVGVKDRRALGYLSKVLTDDGSPAVRIRAVEALGFVQLPQAIPILQTALIDRDAGVRIWATEVIGRVLAKDFE